MAYDNYFSFDVAYKECRSLAKRYLIYAIRGKYMPEEAHKDFTDNILSSSSPLTFSLP